MPSKRDYQGQPATQYPDGTFMYPAQFGSRYQIGSYINATWSSSYKSVNLYYCQYGREADSTPIANNQQITSYNWQVAAQPGTTNWSTPVHLRVVNADGSTDDQKHGGIWSSGFYINEPSSASSSSSPTAAAPTSVTSLQPSSAPAPAPAATSSTTSAQPASSSSGLNSGAKVGVGVGVGLGVPILVALIVAVFFLGRTRRRDSQGGAYSAPPQYPQDQDPYSIDAKYQEPLPPPGPRPMEPVEAPDGTLSNGRERSELPSERF